MTNVSLRAMNVSDKNLNLASNDGTNSPFSTRMSHRYSCILSRFGPTNETTRTSPHEARVGPAECQGAFEIASRRKYWDATCLS
jgi:hypothetical protein